MAIMSSDNWCYLSDESADSENEASGAILEEWGRQLMVMEYVSSQELTVEDMHAEVGLFLKRNDNNISMDIIDDK